MTQTKKDEDPGATDVKGSLVQLQTDNGFLGRTGPCRLTMASWVGPGPAG